MMKALSIVRDPLHGNMDDIFEIVINISAVLRALYLHICEALLQANCTESAGITINSSRNSRKPVSFQIVLTLQIRRMTL